MPTSKIPDLLAQLVRAPDGALRTRLRADVLRLAADAGPALVAYARAGENPAAARREAWDALAARWAGAPAAIEGALAGDDRERDPGLVLHLARLLRHGAPERAGAAIARAMSREPDAALRARLGAELVLAGPVTDVRVLTAGLVDGPAELTSALLRGALSATGPDARRAAQACREALQARASDLSAPVRDVLAALAVTADGVDVEAGAALERTVTDERLGSDVRAAALRARVEGATPAERTQLLLGFATRTPSIAPRAIDELARIGDTDALALIATEHADADVRACAVATMPAELDRLEGFLVDASPAVRAAALRRLPAVRGGGEEPRRLAGQALAVARDDGERFAAAAALAGLLVLSGEPATDDEIASLYDFACRAQDPAVSARAMAQLAQVGGRRACALLEARRTSADAAERDRIDRVLGSIERKVR